MKSLTIVAVHYDPERDRFEVVKEVVHDDDRVDVFLHTFFAETLECKAAEYGIETPEEAIDIIIYEPHIEPVDVMGMSATAARDLHLPKVRQLKESLNRSKELARADVAQQQSKLRDRGIPQKYIDAVTDDPYAAIKARAPFDPEMIVVRKGQVAKLRTGRQNAEAEVERRKHVKTRPSGEVRARQEIARQQARDNMSTRRQQLNPHEG